MPHKRSAVKRHAVTQPLDTSYRYIPLTRNLNAIVDADDFDWLSKWNWHAVWNPCTKSFYATRTNVVNNGVLGLAFVANASISDIFTHQKKQLGCTMKLPRGIKVSLPC
jgi:hypothetical protein